ncbi:hypothetical protein [Escherichia coli]|uniref:hypothetical protein n=1 Tax=Escherichia coli TaxID=562 RepID=UPI00374DDACF
MSRKHRKNATSGATAEKTEALDQNHDTEVLDAVGASGDTPEPVADPADVLSADIAERVSYWAANIQAITLPRRLFSSRRLFKGGREIKGFKADLKLVYAFLLMLHDSAAKYAAENNLADVPFTLAVPVGDVRDAFGLTEATTQRYLAMLGDGQSKKTGETFFGLVEWESGCKGFHIVNIHDLRVKNVAGFELK